MENLLGNLQIQVNSNIFLKDPNSSELGKSILTESILLLDEMGLEHFTFRKLALKLNTTESSIYRYFESKHKLLIYLTSWYWGWLEYQLVFATTNLESPIEKLKSAISVLSIGTTECQTKSGMDLKALNRIILSESPKSYLNKEVEECNEKGFYIGYKKLVNRVSDIVLEIDPNYAFSHTLISTIIEGIHHQKYFSQHLPSLSSIATTEELANYYSSLAILSVTENSKKS